jgi:hypothetical protein
MAWFLPNLLGNGGWEEDGNRGGTTRRPRGQNLLRNVTAPGKNKRESIPAQTRLSGTAYYGLAA